MTGVFQFPFHQITDQAAALAWWEEQFVPSCEAIDVRVNAALLTREIVASLRLVGEASLGESFLLLKPRSERAIQRNASKIGSPRQTQA